MSVVDLCSESNSFTSAHPKTTLPNHPLLFFFQYSKNFSSIDWIGIPRNWLRSIGEKKENPGTKNCICSPPTSKNRKQVTTIVWHWKPSRREVGATRDTKTKGRNLYFRLRLPHQLVTHILRFSSVLRPYLGTEKWQKVIIIVLIGNVRKQNNKTKQQTRG